jgi:hypothetical protein
MSPKKTLKNLRLKLGRYITTTTIQLHTTCLIQNGLLDKYQTSLKDQIHNLFSMEVNKTHNRIMEWAILHSWNNKTKTHKS